MSFSRGREKQCPRSPADSVPSPGIVGIAEVTMWQLPFLLEWQGDSGSQPTTQVLTGCAGNAKAEQQGFHTLFLVLWAVRVCMYARTCMRKGLGDGGWGAKHLSERIVQIGVEDGNHNVTSRSKELPDFREDQILLQERAGSGHSHGDGIRNLGLN